MTQHHNESVLKGHMPESFGHESEGSHQVDNRGGSSRFGGGGGGIVHDQSIKESPATPTIVAKKLGKMMPVRVQMLDDSITLFQVQSKAPGKILFDQVCKQLNLLEVDYFGLEYQDSQGISYWLDVEKQMNHQVCLQTGSQPLLRFSVKFYTPDPAQVEEEYTRYLFSLQIKRDLSMGALQCNDNTAALLASYIVQSECGDYASEDYPDHTYLSTYKFVPHQDAELEVRIMENHKKHIGLSPADADLNLLETARRCELYGIKMHPAKDHDGVPLNLSVAHMGVVVFQITTKINTFSWAKIRKLSFKRKKYLIKLHPEGYGYYKDTVEFYFEDRNHCKNFWKKCVEHHSFFRCSATTNREREKHRLLSKGSSFRYCGKTQKQMQEYVRENFVKRQSFQRHGRTSQSGRLYSSMANVGQSMSAQPLLPIRENADRVVDQSFVESESPRNNNSTYESSSTKIVTSPTSAASYELTEAPAYQSIFANALSLNNSSSRQDTFNNTTINNSSNIINNNAVISQPASPRAPSPMKSSVGLEAGSNSTGGVGGHYGMASSPLRLLREESIDANGTLSPISSRSNGTDTDIDGKKKRHPSDQAYFIAKEILMTERTYKKDLEIINLWFRDEVSKEEDLPEDLLSLLFSHLDPIYELHCSFLKDIEQRMATWEGRGVGGPAADPPRIGDVILRNFDAVTTDYYLKYVDAHSLILEKLEAVLATDMRFAQIYREFEDQKVCYLPITTLLLKPMHRILHYELLLDRLLKHYGPSHVDYHSTNMALVKMQSVIRKMSVKLRESENFVKLAELQRDLGGYEQLLHQDREFLREGCLQKLSRKGYQQRMFFLFSDMLLYANRTTTPKLHFRIHGQMALRDLSVLDSEPRLGAEFCFNLYDGKKAVLLAASNQQEKMQWMEDIAEAAQIARERSGSSPELPMPKFTSLKSMSGSEDGLDRTLNPAAPVSSESQQQRAHSSVHVCWHRCTTVPVSDYHRSIRSLLSGYLLRKFKSSNGWQKLWVVFTNSCLYFFKTFQDDFPLASLPLLGYDVRRPDPASDDIQKDFVFKLVFKNHVYFFRAESQYTFNRWIEVLGAATGQLPDSLSPNGNS